LQREKAGDLVRGSIFRTRGFVFLLVVPLLCVPGGVGAREIPYIYDELNQFIGVVDQQGNAAEFVYDTVGNILQIKRFTVDPNAAVGIIPVRPSSGPLGATVEIFGNECSNDPARDIVTFNGCTTTSVSPVRSTGRTSHELSLASRRIRSRNSADSPWR
jgi:YD repeat-containing protein